MFVEHIKNEPHSIFPINFQEIHQAEHELPELDSSTIFLIKMIKHAQVFANWLNLKYAT